MEMDTENTETAVKKSKKKSKAKDDTGERMQEDKPSEVVDGYAPESEKKKKKEKRKESEKEEINGGPNGVNGFDLGENGTAKKKKKKKDQDDGVELQTSVEVKKKKKKSKGGDK